MKICNIVIATGVAGCCLLASSSNAQAAVFTVPGYGTYNVTATNPTVSFATDSALLSSQPWFGNQSEASAFAETVGLSLGIKNVYNLVSFGPFFCYSADSFSANADATAVYGTTLNLGPFFRGNTYSFAIASPVPEPSEVLGTIALGAVGVGYLVKRQFKKRYA